MTTVAVPLDIAREVAGYLSRYAAELDGLGWEGDARKVRTRRDQLVKHIKLAEGTRV